MRTSIAGAAFLLVGAGAATVAAVDSNGNNIALNGSDTLFDVTNDVLTACNAQFGDASSIAKGLTYNGGGSGVGSGQMDLGAQEVSPMSRALKSSEYCGIATAARRVDRRLPAPACRKDVSSSASTASRSSLVNKTNTCVVARRRSTSARPAPIAVTDTGVAGGPTPTSCPGCDASNNYTFKDSFDALKVLYFGLTNDNVVQLREPRSQDAYPPVDESFFGPTVRRAMARARAASRTHGAVAIFRARRTPSTTSSAPGACPAPRGSARSRRFRTRARRRIPSATRSTRRPRAPAPRPSRRANGGAADFTDLDPIRTNCNPLSLQTDSNGNIISGTGDEVCEPTKSPAGSTLTFAGDLGVVLTVFLPDTKFTTNTDDFPKKPCGTSCVLVAPVKSNKTAGFKCPDSAGGTILGGCYMPYAGTAANPDPRCVAAPTTRCFDVGSKKNDGRSYNLVTVVDINEIPTVNQASTSSFKYQFDIDQAARPMVGSYYRIHSVSTGPHNVPDASVGTTGFCNENDDTSQIGCLVDSDPCSVGYAGRLASRFFPGNTPPPNTSVGDNLKALAVLGVPPFTPGADPDLGLKNLLKPAGTTPLYPLSRRLYFATIYGFGNLSNGERELSQCYSTNTIVNAAMTNRFVAVPGGVECLDYPEESGVTATPSPNIQGAGNVALGGCGMSLTAHDACTDPATAPAICGDGIVATGFGEQCDPPNGTTCDTSCKTIP